MGDGWKTIEVLEVEGDDDWKTVPGGPSSSEPAGSSTLDQVEAAARGYGQGALFGFSDEVSAAGNWAADKLGLGRDEPPRAAGRSVDAPLAPEKGYGDFLEQERAANTKAAENNPALYYGGDMAGSVVTGAALPAASVAGGASKADKLRRLMGVGSLVGATERVGRADRTEENPGGTPAWSVPLQGGAEGAMLAPVGGKVADAAVSAGGRVARKIGGAVRNKAESLHSTGRDLSMRAAGIRNKTDRKAIDSMPGGREKFVEDMRAEGIGQGKRFGATTEAHVEDAGRAKSAAVQSMDDASRSLTKQGVAIDGQRVAERVEREVLADMVDDPALRSEAKALRDLAEGYAEQGTVPFSKAHVRRQNLDKKINFQSTNPLQASKKELRGILNDEMNLAADAVDDVAAQQWRDANRSYQVSNKISKAGGEFLDTKNANRLISPTDYMSATGGAIYGGATEGDWEGAAKGALIGTATNRLIRGREHGLMSKAAHTTGRLLEKIAGAPKAAGANIAVLAVQRAAQSGKPAVAAEHYIQSERSSAYRRIFGEDAAAEQRDKDDDRDQMGANVTRKLGLKGVSATHGGT